MKLHTAGLVAAIFFLHACAPAPETPPAFLTPLEGEGGWRTESRFGRNVAPPPIAPAPVAARIAAGQEGPHLRVVVLGGSAAAGVPDPAFSLGRVLEAMLRRGGKEMQFEVVNAALEGADSAVVAQIAEECARLEPDVWVLYLGHHEVTGPNGPAWPFADGMTRLRETGSGLERWVEEELGDGDPHLDDVYRAFYDNLLRIVTAAGKKDARVVLVTPPANVLDSPPFASEAPPATDADAWQAAFDRGVDAQQKGDHDTAATTFDEAMAIFDGHAELHFRLGHVERARGNGARALLHLEQARDLDMLRLRADGRILETIREVALDAPGKVILVDAARELTAEAGAPGNAFFYDHVHLNLRGNYAIARLIAGALESGSVPTLEQVASDLGLTERDLYLMADRIHARTAGHPFSAQVGHEARRRLAGQSLLELRRRAQAGLAGVEEVLREVLELYPDDLLTRSRLADLLIELGRPRDSVTEWDELLRRLPGHEDYRIGRALALTVAGELDAAQAELQALSAEAPDYPGAATALAGLMRRQGRIDEARRLYAETIEAHPGFVPARLYLASLEEEQGSADAARAVFEATLAVDPACAPAHLGLARLADRAGETDAAIAAYLRAIEHDPTLAEAHNDLGYALESQGERADAMLRYRTALDVDPTLPQAHFNLADALLIEGRAEPAIVHYRAGLEAQPQNTMARFNLGLCLQLADRNDEALDEYRRILRTGGEDAYQLMAQAIDVARRQGNHELADTLQQAMDVRNE